MPVPKKKVSRSCRNMRRAHDSLDALNYANCKSCGNPRLPHSACDFCGTYNGRKLPVSVTKAKRMSIIGT